GAAEACRQVAELLRLRRAAGGHVLRVEIQHHGLAACSRQGEGLAGGAVGREILHLRADLRGGHQFFTGSRMASRFCESQYSMKSSRRWPMARRAGTLIIICTANMAAPVWAAA